MSDYEFAKRLARAKNSLFSGGLALGLVIMSLTFALFNFAGGRTGVAIVNLLIAGLLGLSAWYGLFRSSRRLLTDLERAYGQRRRVQELEGQAEERIAEGGMLAPQAGPTPADWRMIARWVGRRVRLKPDQPDFPRCPGPGTVTGLGQSVSLVTVRFDDGQAGEFRVGPYQGAECQLRFVGPERDGQEIKATPVQARSVEHLNKLIGTRVMIAADSRYADQNAGQGVIRERLTSEVTSNWVRVTFDDGDWNNYRVGLDPAGRPDDAVSCDLIYVSPPEPDRRYPGGQRPIWLDQAVEPAEGILAEETTGPKDGERSQTADG